MSTVDASTPRSACKAGCLVVALCLSLIGLGVPATAIPAPVTPQISLEAAYPRTTDLPEPEADDQDAAASVGLTPFHEIAPVLNEAQASSDRVSVEIVGRSAEGRDLYLVTLTAPEKKSPSAEKLPVLINANLHGEEREGTDAALELVRDYAFSRDPAVERTLRSTRIHILICANPDGRVSGTRENAAGFDLNRDLLTTSQPESQAVRDTIVRLSPAMVLDVHGYANGTLIEPTTAPFAQNIEFDLAMRHALPNAVGIEEAITNLDLDDADDVRPPQIPLRDWDQGWDGWAPVFTAQYAGLHGAIGQTVELPLATNNEAESLPTSELARRGTINTQVARAAMEATIKYADRHHDDLLADQGEGLRRALAGEPGRAAPLGQAAPDPDLIADPGATVAVEPFAYPRAYVIPTGVSQRSGSAAARLVRQLNDHGVEVQVVTDPVRIGGSTYSRGTYVIDMHQAKRGVANAMLSEGTDASSLSTAMYDVSAWSLAALWGADVVTVPADGTAILSTSAASATPGSAAIWNQPSLRALTADDLVPSSSPSPRGPWRLNLRDPADIAAMNALLDEGVSLRFEARSGSVIIPADAQAEVREAASTFGIPIRHTGDSPADRAAGVPLDRIRVAAAADDEKIFALREMGFDVTPVTATTLNRGFDFDGIDTLMVSDGLDVDDLSADSRASLVDFLDHKGGFVAQGPDGLEFNDDLDLLPVYLNSGRGDANGVVAVTSSPTGLARGASSETFVNAPYWFTDVGEGVIVDQRYAASDPLRSGHWRATPGTPDSPQDAAGGAMMVHGIDSQGPTAGAAITLFGSDPLFRAHPKGQYALVAQALLWTATAQ